MTTISKPRLTIRMRLTLVYGGLFFVAGVVVLFVTYGLVAQRLPAGTSGSALLGAPAGTARLNDTLPSPLPSPTVSNGVLKMVVQGKIQTRHDALVTLLTGGGITLAAVGIAAVALGWLIAGRLLQPLQRMTDTAQRIAQAPAAGDGLHERIALQGPQDEIKQLADTFDAMIERLDKSFDGQRRFVANASHELRTPLTLNRALLEVAVRRNADSAEIVALGETLLEVNARHGRLIDGLLLLTRAEPEVTDRSYVDLADVVEHVVSQVPPGQVRLTAEAGEAPTTGNPELLERLVHNLVENAVRYNTTDGQGWVTVTSTTGDEGAAVLVVANTGPVIPKYDVAGLFEPFRRLDTERLSGASPGAGLGLSIVNSVARAHGGRAEATPREGGGLVVTVTLPGAPLQPLS